MNRRVLAVLEAGDVYPSGFLRVLIYRDLFAHAGYAVRYTSRLWPALRRALEHPPAALSPFLRGRPWARLEALVAALREPAIVRMARSADVVYMSKVS